MAEDKKNARAIFGGILVAGALVALYGLTQRSAPPVPDTTPSSQQLQTEAPPSKDAPSIPESPPLNKAEVAQALSQYMAQVHSQFFAHAVLQQTIQAQIRQAVQWRDLDKFQKAAERLKQTSMDMQMRVAALPYPDNMSEEDLAKFDQVSERVSDVTASMVEMSVDVAAAAHTGLDFTDEAKKDAAALDKASGAMTKTVLEAYKYYGISSKSVDKKDLTILTK